MTMTAQEWSFDGKLTKCLCRSKIQGRMQFYNTQWCINFCLLITNRKEVFVIFCCVSTSFAICFIYYVVLFVGRLVLACWNIISRQLSTLQFIETLS